jgi:DNA polymerase III delta prime subunit
MTKNAQQALRYLLQNYSNNVRFCLICNYISKIDEGLQNEFIRLRFNQLPKDDIIHFLSNISQSENLNLNYNSLSCIQKLYKSDIRSMINFMQSNQDIVKFQNDEVKTSFNVIDNDVWENLIIKIKTENKLDKVNSYIQDISNKYNIDKKNIIKDFLNFIIRNNKINLTSKFLNFVENIMHTQNQDTNNYISYFLSRLSSFIISQ